MDFTQHNIQAAVRLRPMIFCVGYNRHELDKGAKLIVKALDSTNVSVVHPEDSLDTQNFGVSHFYWSFDGYMELQDGSFTADFKHVNGAKYCDQRRVFDNFGKEMVQNAWSGYNSTLLCCGESGSGKSWTLFGQGANRGFIPLLASDLFRSIRDKEKGAQAQQMGNSFAIEVKMTMMEIQDDKVRDLLTGMNTSTKFKQSIKLREHPKRGFYVEGLRSVLISTAEEIQIRIDEGMYNRALQCTNLNLVSSNATVVVGLSLLQKYRNSKGDEMIMSSLLDFYDVAESSLSENWVNSHFTPGSSSNNHKPFSFLEKVVAGMPEIKEEVSPETQVNKQSVICKLLNRALFGNCKTLVISCLSPSNLSYTSTLKSLNFVDRVQRLNTHPLINEELSTKLIRELKIENENLRKMLSSNDFEKNEFFAWTEKAQELLVTDKDEFKRQVVDDIKSQIKDNEKEIKNLTMSHEERVKLSKTDRGTNEIVTAAKKLENDKKYSAYIYNLNQDSQLTGKVVHLLPNGNIEFGSQKRKDQPFTLTILGPGIRECHGVMNVSTKDNKVTLRPFAPDSIILLNGDKLVYESPIFNNDRITLGGNQVWIFQNPRDPWADKTLGSKLTYTFAQEEITMKCPFYTKLCEQSPINLTFRNDILELIPLIGDSNAMSSDLEKDVQFEPLVVSTINKSLLEFHEFCEEETAEEVSYSTKHLAIKAIHTKDDMEYIWTKDKFLQRYSQMKSLYVQIQEEGLINIPSNTEEDPFMENTDTAEVPIGYTFISLKPLSYLLEFQQTASISDFLTIQSVGSVKVEITPCNDFFEKLDDSKIFLTHPHEQLGNSLHFMIKLGYVDCSSNFKDIYAKYKFDQDSLAVSTGKLDSKSPSYMLGSSNFKYERRVSIDTVTQKLLDYLENDFLVLSFFGKLRPKKSRNLFSKIETKNMTNTPAGGSSSGSSSSLYHLKDYQRQVADLTVLRKSQDRIQGKLNTLLKLLETTKEISHHSKDSSIPIDYVKQLLDSKHYDTSIQIIAEAAENLKPPEIVPEVPKLSTYQKVSEVCIIS